MPLALAFSSVPLNDPTVTFSFGTDVLEFILGISYWSFTFGKTDQQVSQVSLNLQNAAKHQNQVTCTVAGVLEGGSHNIDAANSQVIVSCIALIDDGDASDDRWEEQNLTLAMETGIKNDSPQSVLLCSTTAKVWATILSGFYLRYPNGKHHVHELQSGASFAPDPAQDKGSLTCNSTMYEGSTHQAENPTTDASLLWVSPNYVIASQDQGYAVISAKQTSKLQTGESTTVTFPSPVTGAVVMLQSMQVQYPGGQKHDIQTVSGGCSEWSVEGSNVVLKTAQALMSDHSHNAQDDSKSNVVLQVVALCSSSEPKR